MCLVTPSSARMLSLLSLLIIHALIDQTQCQNPAVAPYGDPVLAAQTGQERQQCYDETTGKPQRCLPPFVNAAFNARVESTNTCGENGPIEFCVQTGSSGTRKSCEVCQMAPGFAHPAEYMTDFNNNDNQTWWQSETMFEGVQHPNQVNLTLHFGKAFDITYIRLWFQSPRPESFAIYKRSTEDGPWVPYQYYSASCRDMYGLPDWNFARLGEETRALCTSEYSEISPLTGGNIAFSTLYGRPAAYEFDKTPELHDWVTATDIRITLDRLNTFGDEIFGDTQVLRSYFYAISDLAVGAKCKCNGHASECESQVQPDGTTYHSCRCEHNTFGRDCDECLPFYNDAPWGRATSENPHECKACNCEGFSTRCFFDRKLYEQTGHGGHCLDCAGHRDGPNCERCKDNYYQHQDRYCASCDCDPTGSRSLQCNTAGHCQCKPGVTGIKCDRCAANYYEFSSDGCKPCHCDPAGSLGNLPQCDPVSGACLCKENVEGKHCGRCKLGFFNLNLENEFGCNPCFCYGHTSVCSSAPGYSKVDIQSSFSRGAERWSGRDLRAHSVPVDVDLGQAIALTSPSGSPVYFNAPERFLGDQRASYNQLLTFKLRITDSGPSPSVEDVVLEGAGLTITQTIFGQGNPLPGTQFQLYTFRLHDNPKYGWQPRLSSRDYISVLANLTAIRIRATYTPGGTGYLDDVHLVTARIGAAGAPATWVENCDCLNGYIGQFCESCMPGFRHDPPSGGPFSPCVPCNCNGHADICDAESGRCICQDNTSGDNCERCARGYFGNALQGTREDCQKCNCPQDGPCIQLPDLTLVCLECPRGYGGPRCEVCSDGYFGDPQGLHGQQRPCLPCDCNSNVDPNAVGNCNRTTGECLKCIYNSAGSSCDQCKAGFYGDALAPLKGDCRQCQCYEPGTLGSEIGTPHCDQVTGQCKCRPHVQGRNCDFCQDGYFNIASGEGCQACNCDLIGSVNNTCDQPTGQCQCRQGVIGLRCDNCLPYQYGFSLEGCRPCDCDQIGSISLQCDPLGQCPCQENVEGRRCDRCKENKFDRQQGCIDCPACYDLVQTAANRHRDRLAELHHLLDNISSNPTVISDDRFEQELNFVQKAVNDLWSKTKERVGDNSESPSDRLRELYNRIEAVNELDAERNVLLNGAYLSSNMAFENMTLAEATLKEAEDIFKNALDELQTRGEDALKNAQERSKQFGQQNDQMAEIARSARKMAEEQEEEAEAIKKLADDALNTTNEAFNLANKTLEQQQQIENDMDSLKMQLDDSANRLSMTQKLAMGTQEMVKEVLDNAFDNYFEVNALNPPETNASDIKTEAQQAQEEANRIKTEAEKVLNKHESLQDDLERQIANTETLLGRGTRQQQLTDELLADVDAAKSKAEDAVRLGDSTLAIAEETLDTLQKFDKQVQDSKAKARKSLDEVPEIRTLILLAENKTKEAQKALEGAEMNAQKAEKLANEAHEEYAKNASVAAAEIVEAAEKTKAQANELRDLAENQAARVIASGKGLKQHEDKAEQEEALISEAKEKVGQAKTDAIEAAKQVAKALDEVQEIKRILEELPNLNYDGLDDLERRLEAAQKEFAAANLDDRIEQIRSARLEQTKAINEYKDQLDLLEGEVENIEAIYNSLPEGCWKRIILEP